MREVAGKGGGMRVGRGGHEGGGGGGGGGGSGGEVCD